MDDLPPHVVENKEDEEHTEGRNRNGEEINRDNVLGVVRQKRTPSLRWRFSMPHMYLETVAWLTSMPSLSNSPWIRGAPQSGLSRDILPIRLRTSLGTLRLPGHRGRLFHLQY
jgi:hypothetical protein